MGILATTISPANSSPNSTGSQNLDVMSQPKAYPPSLAKTANQRVVTVFISLERTGKIIMTLAVNVASVIIPHIIKHLRKFKEK